LNLAKIQKIILLPIKKSQVVITFKLCTEYKKNIVIFIVCVERTGLSTLQGSNSYKNMKKRIISWRKCATDLLKIVISSKNDIMI